MSEALAMTLLEDWCRGMEVDLHRSLLVTGIPENCGQADIEEILNGVLSPLGTYRVLNRIFMRADNVKAALVEVNQGVNLSSIPREFPGRGGVWQVTCRDPTQDAEFLRNLKEFLGAEGRSWEDVARLLWLSPPPRLPGQPWEAWAEGLGVLLGTVVQTAFHLDQELRSQREAMALGEAEAEAAWPSVPKEVRKELALGADLTSALKMVNPKPWNEAESQGASPRRQFAGLVRRAGAKIRSRRKKQIKYPKQELGPWKKPKGRCCCHCEAYWEASWAADPQSLEMAESSKSTRKPRVKRQGLAWKKKRAWKIRRGPPRAARREAEGPGGTDELDQDGGPGRPPKKRAVGKTLALTRKKKKRVSVYPVSHVLADSKRTKKKPAIAKKGPASRRALSAQRVPRGPRPAEEPASRSRAPKAKLGSCPRASKASRKVSFRGPPIRKKLKED